MPRNYSRGTARWSAKLTEELVLRIRARRAAGEKLSVLAGEHNVADSTISRACRGLRWKHIA